jgi:hypothetical protein
MVYPAHRRKVKAMNANLASSIEEGVEKLKVARENARDKKKKKSKKGSADDLPALPSKDYGID